MPSHQIFYYLEKVALASYLRQTFWQLQTGFKVLEIPFLVLRLASINAQFPDDFIQFSKNVYSYSRFIANVSGNFPTFLYISQTLKWGILNTNPFQVPNVSMDNER